MSTASNPQIAVITYMEKKIAESLDKGEYLLALRQMLTLLNLIRKTHRDSKLITKISKEYRKLMGDTESKREKYSQQKALIYVEWFGEVTQILYIQGYLVDQGYEMVYTSELDPKLAYKSPLLTE